MAKCGDLFVLTLFINNSCKKEEKKKKKKSAGR